MRFYNIVITDAQTGNPIKDAAGQPFGPYSSFQPVSASQPTLGTNLAGALDIELDLPLANFATNYISLGYLKIWGIGLPVMGQSSQFNPNPGYTKTAAIKIYGGLYPGLPLASAAFNAGQTGLLFSGVIQQAFGNWEGTQQNLNFVLQGNAGDLNKVGGYGSPEDVRNIIWDCNNGQQMGDAAVKSLQNAFPGASITSNVSTNLVMPYDHQFGNYQTVGQFADMLNRVSIAVFNDPTAVYQGIKVAPTPTGFNLYDGYGPTQKTPKKIVFTDLIGQPVWLNLAQINFKTSMRADLKQGDEIQMPAGPQISSAQSFSQYRNRVTFQGVFTVLSVRHLGHFKGRGGDSWVTVVDAIFTRPASSS